MSHATAEAVVLGALDERSAEAPPLGPAFSDARAAAAAFDGERPLLIARPHILAAATRAWTQQFPGDVLYAVKANPEPWVLDTVHAHGAAGFEVASSAESARIHALQPGALAAFMHPVKPPAAITRAFEEHGRRVFALDHVDELDKIANALDGAHDITLMVRLAVSNEGAQMPLLNKFGARPDDAVDLLRAAAARVERVGLTFHVGSQNHRPETFTHALRQVGAVAQSAQIPIAVIDVGGGFPELYPGEPPPPPSAYRAALEAGRAELPGSCRDAVFWCEPGRALVGGAVSAVVTVELRKDDVLYINDGGAGVLFDAAYADWRQPARLLRDSDAPQTAFHIYGPTCDSADELAHRLTLPGDVRCGDRLEIGHVGAYGAAMASPFNGFGRYDRAVALDTPWPSWAAQALSGTAGELSAPQRDETQALGAVAGVMGAVGAR